jgi:phage pi2 protein 07
MKRIKIVTTKAVFEFTGQYRRDLEVNNWHYYEDENGNLYHFRKAHMIMVHEKEIKHETN